MGLTLTLADAVLKDDYQGPVRKLINDKVILTSRASKHTEGFVGRQAVLACHVGRNVGVGSRLEGETMPQAGNQTTIKQLVTVKNHKARIRLTKEVLTRMDTDRGAFITAIKLEMNGLVSDCSRDQERQSWGTSDGKVAQCGTTTATTTVQLATTTPDQVLWNIQEGMRVDIGTVANPQLRAASRTVTAVDFTNKTITIDGAAITTASTDFVFRQGNGGSTTNQREVTGIQSMISSSGTLFNINPSTYPAWASVADSNSGTTRPVSENLVEKQAHKAENRSGEPITTLYAEDGVYRSAAEQLKARQRVVNSLDLKGGHKGIEYNFGAESAPLVKARDCPVGIMLGVRDEDLVEFVDEDWSWEDMDGSVWRLATDGTHSFEAIYYKSSEFACYRRNTHFIISDLEQA